MTRTRTAIVIPAYNEQASLPAVLAELASVVPDYDVVVVDDGSADATSEVAHSAGVVVVTLPYNLGIGGALRTGFRYAADNGYDAAVQFDADGQHDAANIAVLLTELDDGADMVIGSRFAGVGDYDVRGPRKLGMGVLRFLTRRLVGKSFSDTSSGFRAIARPLLVEFARNYPAEYMDSVETLVSACRAGFDVREVPVVMHARTAGEPSNKNFRLFYNYARLLVVLFASGTRRRPQLINPARST